MDVAQLVVIAVVLIGGLALVVRGARPRSGPARRWSDLRDYEEPGGGAGFLAVLLTTIALVQVAGVVPTTPNALAAGGAAVAVAAACARSMGVPALFGLGATVVGLAATPLDVVQLFSGSGCGSVMPTVGTVAVVLVLLVALMWGTLVGVLAGVDRFPLGLRWFAATDVVVFLAAPFGVSVISSIGEDGFRAFIVTVVAAAVLGFLASLTPVLVAGLAAIAAGLAAASAGVVGLTCAGSSTGACAMVAAAATHVLLRRVGSSRTKKRGSPTD